MESDVSITSDHLTGSTIAAGSVTTGKLSIRRDDGEVIFEVRPTGEVVGSINNAGEAAHIFARTLEQQLGFKRTD